jgi:hypothetical protein
LPCFPCFFKRKNADHGTGFFISAFTGISKRPAKRYASVKAKGKAFTAYGGYAGACQLGQFGIRERKPPTAGLFFS